MNDPQRSTSVIEKANPLHHEILYEGQTYFTGHYHLIKHRERCHEEGKIPQYAELKSFVAAIKTWEHAAAFVQRGYLLPLAWRGKRQGSPSVIFDPSWKDKIDQNSGREIL